MEEIVEVLENMNGKPGLKNRLVDDEGFPRDDVDIFETRKLRNRHACLQTDYKTLMKEIENRLYGLHKIYIDNKLYILKYSRFMLFQKILFYLC